MADSWSHPTDKRESQTTSEPSQYPAVLLVDDSPENLLALEAILTPLQCRLLKASSGEDALKVLLDEECAVVLLDVNMPGLSGYETAAFIRERERTANVPIIFLTAYHKDEADVIRGYAYGAVDYIFKPVAADLIRAKVDCFIALAAHTQWLEQKNHQLGRAQQELRATKAAASESDRRWRKQNQVLADLSRSAVGEFVDLDTAFRKITTATAHTLDVERAAVWLFSDNRSILHCRDLYEMDVDRHTTGAELDTATCPRYFQILEEERTFAIHDLRSDSRAAELIEQSSIPAGVISRLDAAIRKSGRLVGIVCHEHSGPTRHWSSGEEHFAASIADIVALAIEAVERRQVVGALEQSNAALEQSEVALQEKIRDLENFQAMVVGRELKMMELEKQIQGFRLEIVRLREQLDLRAK